jgi:virginiamycin B lyase
VVYISVSARSAREIGDAEQVENNQQQAIQRFEQQFCGAEPSPNSNPYITEITLPTECEMPLGIAIEDDKIWYVSTKRGLLASYDTATSEFNQYEIPSWPSRSVPFTAVPSWSMSWTVKLDASGNNVWFTDQNNSIWRFNKPTEDFDRFHVPANYPSAMDFDSQGNIYFIGINSKSLFFGNVSKITNATSEGFEEISLPLDGFAGVNSDLITSGGLVVDNEREDVWISLLAFQQNKGQLFVYDIESNKIMRIVDLPDDLGAPVGMELDDYGNLWVADHGTSTFFKYDPTDGSITKFVTSIASPKIYGGITPPSAYTLPYWIEKGDNGSLWFNEHTGNKIAHFDPEQLTLIEYWIPSQNRVWALCPEGVTPCGLANVMQFTVGSDSQVWFSEWTENKIAKLNASTQVPIAVSTPLEVAVAKGRSIEINVAVNASADFSGRMMAAATLTPNAALGNSTGIFSEESLTLRSGGSKEVSYTFTPADDLMQGQYMIMLGAGDDNVSYMKAVKLNIV